MRNGRAFYFVSFFRFYVVNMIKNQKKIKKIRKNEKKLQKNLHISKKSCTFAPSNEKDTKTTPIRNPKI